MQRYLIGEESAYSLAEEINTHKSVVGSCEKQYVGFGENSFDESKSNSLYTNELKEIVVLAYLNGEVRITIYQLSIIFLHLLL